MAHRLPHENRHGTFQSDRFEKLITAAAMKQLQIFSNHFIVTITDKAPGSFAFICKVYCEIKVIEALISNRYLTLKNTEAELSTIITTASKQFGVQTDKLYNRHTRTYSDTPELLPTFFFTLKAHKSPPGLRPIVATNGTAISALSSLASRVQSVLMPPLNELWCAVAKACDLPCAGSWINNKSADVPIRIANALRYKLNWYRHMQVFDFVGMYETFVHHDMKEKLNELYSLIFDYQEGKTVFSEYSDFGYRGGLKRRSGDKKKSEVIYSKSYHKGIKAIEDVTWSDIEANTAIESGVRVDIQKLVDMTDFIIDHTHVQHNNSIYRQRMGIAMGMNNSPQWHTYTVLYMKLNLC
jgi:hypothetical protein